MRGARAGIFNFCELAERGPVVLAFFATRSDRCQQQIDLLERCAGASRTSASRRSSVRGDRGDVRAVRERGWGMPVAYDHDGAVTNAYGVAVCPTITFARRGGWSQTTSLKLLGEAEPRRATIEALR